MMTFHIINIGMRYYTIIKLEPVLYFKFYYFITSIPIKRIITSHHGNS